MTSSYRAMKMTWLWLLGLALVSRVVSERLHEQIYSPITGAAACFRRLNATHQAGCSSVDGGAVGAVAWVQDVAEAHWAANGGGGGGPYAALVSTALFNDVAEILIASPHNIAGVILYENHTHVPQFYSPESQCPNEYAAEPGDSCGGEGAWNPQGLGLLRRDVPFPIFFLPAERSDELHKIIDCYERFNGYDREEQAGRPLCSVQLSSFMFAAVNTKVCMRRSSAMNLSPIKQCDPLGDRNIHYSTSPRGQEGRVEANRSVILVTARLDSASLFDGVSPGAASAAVGVVTLLTAARTLATMLPPTDAVRYDRSVVWALFSGESFDYVGSQRAAHDMRRGSWPPGAPLVPAQVDVHLELGQLGGRLAERTAGEWALTAFSPPYNASDDAEIGMLVEELGAAEPSLRLTRSAGGAVPPSSLHSFRRELGAAPAAGGLVELLLVDHGRAFTNRYYQSALDGTRAINYTYCNRTVDDKGTFYDTTTMIENGFLTVDSPQVKISTLANAVAKTLYQRVTGTAYVGVQSASAHLVDELLHCYLESGACRLWAASEYAAEGAEAVELPAAPPPLYTGVTSWYNRAPYATGLLLALLTGHVNTTSRDECTALRDKAYTFYWLYGWNNTGVCVQSTVNFTDAVSPAFTIPDYDYSSGVYSTWSESVWRGLWARVFVAAGGRGARVAAALGALATLLAAALTYWLHRHAHTIFTEPASAAVDPSTAGILRTVNC